MSRSVLGALMCCGVVACTIASGEVPGSGKAARAAARRQALPPLSISGNRIVAGGVTIQLRGINRSGTEYACVQDFGIFDGPSSLASVRAIKSWGANIVRLPLNEDCWLGINRRSNSPAYYGRRYVAAIERFVNLLNANGMYAELSLVWAAPGNYQATYQSGGPDQDHSPAVWTSLARTFAHNRQVILAPWGETVTGWRCFMQTGCTDQATYGPNNRGYQTAPMQEAVNDMRAAGYHGPIAIPCIAYGNECADYNGSSWLRTHPRDPDHALIAEAHVYGKQLVDTIAAFDSNYAPLVARFPMIWGETGEDPYGKPDTSARWIRIALPWADAHGVSYEAWAWEINDPLALVTNYIHPQPPTAYARYVRDHLLARARRSFG